MGDPLSVTASAAGLVSLAGSIYSTINTFVENIRDAPSQARALRSELGSFRDSLSSFPVLLESPAYQAQRARLCSAKHVETSLRNAFLSLDELSDELAPLTKRSKMTFSTRARWAAKDSRLQKLVARLQFAKITLILQIDILQCKSTRDTMQAVERLDHKMEEKMRYDREFEKRIQAFDGQLQRMHMDLAAKLQKSLESLEISRMEVWSLGSAIHDQTGMLKLRDLETAAQKQRQLKQQIAAWIKGNEDEGMLDSRSTLHHNVEKHHPSTCKWLLEHPEYVKWHDSRTSASLFISGPPGAGKTVMASFVASELQKQGLRTAIFFYSFDDPVRRKAITALRTLSRTLLSFYDDAKIPDAVVSLYEADATNFCSKLADLGTATKVLASLMRQIPRVHLILDGLDECQDDVQLLYMLDQLIPAQAHGAVKWIFSGRPGQQLRMKMRKHGVNEIKVSPQSMTNDIRAFVVDRLYSHEGYCAFIEEWVSKANGNFLWVTVMLRTFEGMGSTCEEERIEELNKFPGGLTGCYMRVLHQLTKRTKQEQELARKVFAFLVATTRPIPLSALSHALAATKSKQSMDELDWSRIPNPSVIEEICSNLVEFVRNDTGHEVDPAVRFCHKSVQEFFLQGAEIIEAPREIKHFFTTETVANEELGRASLKYLQYQRYSEPRDITTLLRQKEHAFLQYAAIFWHFHLSFADPTPELYEEVLKFTASPCFWNCVAVQSFIAPQLFGVYRQVRNDAGSRSKLATVNFGVPLPMWLDNDDFGNEGRARVKDLHAFVKQWHPILDGTLGAYQQHSGKCLMDAAWESRWQQKSAWRSREMHSWTLPTSQVVDIANLQLTIVEVTLEGLEGCQMVAISSDRIKEIPKKFVCERQVCSLKNGTVHDHTIEQRQLSDLAYDAHMESVLLLDERRSQDSQDIEDFTWIQHRTATTENSSDIAVRSSNIAYFEHGISSLAVAIQYTHRINMAAGDQDRDRSESDSSWDSEDEQDSTYPSDSAPALRSSTPYVDMSCLVIYQGDREPLAFCWPAKRAACVAMCAFHPSDRLAYWSPSVGIFCVANLLSGEVKKMPLPEPECEHLPSALHVYKEFHYVEAREMLCYLLVATNKSEANRLDMTLSVSVFKFKDTSGVLALSPVSSTVLSYACETSGKIPSVLTRWTTHHVYVALPPLWSIPKVVRLGISNGTSAADTLSSTFDTLREPVVFPASTPNRSPSLCHHSDADGKESLMLMLAAETPRSMPTDTPVTMTMAIEAGTDEYPSRTLEQDEAEAGNCQSSVLMTWAVGADDWREFDPLTDAVSKGLSPNAHLVDSRGYVNAKKGFPVPVRSGLNWTSQQSVNIYCGCD